MRYAASEKLEIIRLVEESTLPVRRTLEKLGIPRATFYRWYDLPSRIASGTAFRTMFATASSRWRLMSRRCRRANWRCGSPTPKAILSPRPRSIGCSRQIGRAHV